MIDKYLPRRRNRMNHLSRRSQVDRVLQGIDHTIISDTRNQGQGELVLSIPTARDRVILKQMLLNVAQVTEDGDRVSIRCII